MAAAVERTVVVALTTGWTHTNEGTRWVGIFMVEWAKQLDPARRVHKDEMRAVSTTTLSMGPQEDP